MSGLRSCRTKRRQIGTGGVSGKAFGPCSTRRRAASTVVSPGEESMATAGG